jgi:hypothetical protein
MIATSLLAFITPLGGAVELLLTFIVIGLVVYWNKFLRRPPTRRW